MYFWNLKNNEWVYGGSIFSVFGFKFPSRQEAKNFIAIMTVTDV